MYHGCHCRGLSSWLTVSPSDPSSGLRARRPLCLLDYPPCQHHAHQCMAPWDTASFCRLSYGLTVPWVSNDKSGRSQKPECQELKVNKANMVQSSRWSESWEHFLLNINEHSPALDSVSQGFINSAFCASVCHAASATIACSCWGHWKGWLVETSNTLRCQLPLVQSRQLNMTSQFGGVVTVFSYCVKLFCL